MPSITALPLALVPDWYKPKTFYPITPVREAALFKGPDRSVLCTVVPGEVLQPSGPPKIVNGTEIFPIEGGKTVLRDLFCAAQKQECFDNWWRTESGGEVDEFGNPALIIIEIGKKCNKSNVPLWMLMPSITADVRRGHKEFQYFLKQGYYSHGYVPRNTVFEPKQFDNTCLIDAFRRLGLKVKYALDGPFWAKRHGNAFLLQFNKVLINNKARDIQEGGKYIVDVGGHLVAVRVQEDYTE